MYPQTYRVNNQDLSVIRTTRKQSIALKAKPSGIIILVPKALSVRRLNTLLKNNQAWLFEAHVQLVNKMAQDTMMPVFKGELEDVFEFKGLGYRMQLKDGSASKLLTMDADNQICRVNRLGLEACHQLQAFFIDQAIAYLTPKLTEFAEIIGVRPKSLTVKGYKSRWGSCYFDGRIQFNWRLMQAPEWVIDYVVVHELCHLVYPNHSAEFWALVQQHFPRTLEAKATIRQHGGQWIQFLNPLARL